jgi:predicted aspartyl protease
MLQGPRGRVFATGEARFSSHRALAADRLTRIHLQVQIGTLRAEAVVDTGGAYLVLDPAVASVVVLGPAVHTDRLVIRGFVFAGTVHRVSVTIPAVAGESLTFEATAFVPELGVGEQWPLPSYLGWQGCLDRIRLALDPEEERVYFGAS